MNRDLYTTPRDTIDGMATGGTWGMILRKMRRERPANMVVPGSIP